MCKCSGGWTVFLFKALQFTYVCTQDDFRNKCLYACLRNLFLMKVVEKQESDSVWILKEVVLKREGIVLAYAEDIDKSALGIWVSWDLWTMNEHLRWDCSGLQNQKLSHHGRNSNSLAGRVIPHRTTHRPHPFRNKPCGAVDRFRDLRWQLRRVQERMRFSSQRDLRKLMSSTEMPVVLEEEGNECKRVADVLSVSLCTVLISADLVHPFVPSLFHPFVPAPLICMFLCCSWVYC